MDQKLKLSIVTALDAAGIKATKEQIEGIEKSLQSLNNKGNNTKETFGGLDGSMTKMPGILGKMQGQLSGIAGTVGKIGGTIAAAIAVWEKGVEIGESIRNFLGEHIDFLKTENQIMQEQLDLEKQREEQYKQELDIINKVVEKKSEIYSKEQTDIDKTTQKIDQQTKAYFRQVNALQGINRSRDNAKVLMLERDKFENQRYYESMGDTASAEQIGKFYDVLIAEQNAKQDLKQIDQERAKLIQSTVSEEEKFEKKLEAVLKIEQRIAQEEEKLNQIGRKDRGDKYKSQQKFIEGLYKTYDKRYDEAMSSAQNLGEYAYAQQRLSVDRANIASKGAFAVDRAAWEYDKYVVQNGNPMNAIVSDDLARDIAETSRKSFDAQEKIVEATSGLSELLERLLELKQ